MTYTKKEQVIRYLIQVKDTYVRQTEFNETYIGDPIYYVAGLGGSNRIHAQTFKFLINQEIINDVDYHCDPDRTDYKLDQFFLNKHPFLTQICGMTEVLAKRRYDDWYKLTNQLTTRDERIPESVWKKWEEYWDGWKDLPKATKNKFRSLANADISVLIAQYLKRYLHIRIEKK